MEPEQLVEIGIAVGVAAMLVVAGAAAIGPRLRVPAPLILVVVGILVSLLPFVNVEVPPQVVLSVVLPPLLYASSVSLPTMDLRREFGTVSLLSVVLVVITAVIAGWAFSLLIPGLDLWWGIALGAVISPTDAVATSIVKRTGVSHRITAILEGESLLNDASALVLLRTAIAGAALTVSFWKVIGAFVWAVLAAILIGYVVARVMLRVRSKVADPAVTTALSFTVPFLASLPTELVQASGLVAAVTAGLVVGRRSPRVLPPQHRVSDEENWRTVSLVLEGSVFLLMGLQISTIVGAAGGVAAEAVPLAFVGVGIVVLVRAAFVVPLLLSLRGRARRGAAMRARIDDMQRRFEAGDRTPFAPADGSGRGRRVRPLRDADLGRFTARLQQARADIDYLAAFPLGPREGAVVVWAGMRGAVTVAAAQTIPLPGDGGPADRDLLVLVAFAVAAVSLLLQGGSLAGLIALVKPARDDPERVKDERRRVAALIRETAAAVPQDPGASTLDQRLAGTNAARAALLDARDLGVYDPQVLTDALAAVDSGQITTEMFITTRED